ncbi:MAG: hypothetical protein JWM62_2973 [Frankiales bacterium]|nr:hypothetical protein [Frankiales bacterium]
MSRAVRVVTALALAASGVGLVPVATAAAPESIPVQTYEVAPRQAAPEDRYALAGGCYAVQDRSSGRWVSRTTDGFTATAASPAAAEPFHLQATDLGRYLLFGTARDFLAGETGPRAGDAVVAAAAPSEAADFVLDGTARQGFTLALGERGVAVGPDGALTLGAPSRLAFQGRSGCAAWPEVQTNVTGPVVGQGTSYEESSGYLDAHLHTMAFEFVGGQARCGRPWHPYGVEHALVDCPDHVAGGRGAVLETVLSGGDPIAGHDTVGWPSFGYWPKHDSLTHEQIYYKWLERTWRGGLRLMTTLLVENGQLCTVYPLKKNSCNEMDAVRLQAQRMKEFIRYIDAQSGGPGEGWIQIVTDPEQARRVMNEGRLAIVLGIEISQLFDCTSLLDVDGCTKESIDQDLQAVYDMGVRQMELANKFDNALTGVTGDEGATGVIVNNGNLQTTGRYWQMATCPGDFPHPGIEHDHEHNVDRRQLNATDDTGAPAPLGGRDSIFAGVLSSAGALGAAPAYGPGPHCNERPLTELGSHLIGRMAEKGMMFDPDHMSASARSASMTLLEKADYDGIVSSHSWSDDTIYARIAGTGGIVTPYPRSVEYFIEEYRKVKAAAAESDQYFGIGRGADTNGFGAQAGPRGADAPDPVRYPFTGFGGTRVDKQVSGERTYDLNTDGVAHYGMYVDWVEDLRRAGGDVLMADLRRGPEAYLQAWERARGVEDRSCRPATGIDGLQKGMTPQQVLDAAGQPHEREGREFRYCVTGRRPLVAEFDSADRLLRVDGRTVGGAVGGGSGVRSGPGIAPTGGSLPATGAPALLALVAAGAALTGLALRRRRDG